jgi:hypothetical protein
MERQGNRTWFKPCGRNQFTKAALGRAIDVARQKGVDRVEVELPGQSRIVLTGIVNKQEPPQKNEWDQELYGNNPPPVR